MLGDSVVLEFRIHLNNSSIQQLFKFEKSCLFIHKFFLNLCLFFVKNKTPNENETNPYIIGYLWEVKEMILENFSIFPAT